MAGFKQGMPDAPINDRLPNSMTQTTPYTAAFTLANIAQDACGARMWEEMRTSWAIALLARAPSVPLVWISARLGLSPMQITAIGLALALSLPLQAALLPLGAAVWAVAFSGWLFQVLDCVDGTLARLSHSQSKRGGDADFLVDMAQWGLLYAALGILADRSFDTGFLWTTIGCAAAWARLLARVIRDRFDLPDPSARPTTPTPKPTPTRLPLKDYPMSALIGLSGLFCFIALLGDWIGAGVAFLLIYALLDIAESLLPFFQRRP